MPPRASPTTSPRPPPAVICGGQRGDGHVGACRRAPAAVSTPRLVAVSSRSPSTKSRAAGHAAARVGHGIRPPRARAPGAPRSRARRALPRLRGCRTTSAPAAPATSRGVVGAAVVDDDDPVDLRQGRARRPRSPRCGRPRPCTGRRRRPAASGSSASRRVRKGRWAVVRTGRSGHQRRVTWRLSRPERARRSSAVRGASEARAAAYRSPQAASSSSWSAASSVGVEVPHRDEQAAGAEGAEQAGVAAEAVLARGVQAGERVGGDVLVVGQDEADVGALADAHPVGRRQRGHPGRSGRPWRWPARATRRPRPRAPGPRPRSRSPRGR